MIKKIRLSLLFIFMVSFVFSQNQYIFPYGGSPNKAFLEEIIKLTGKERPRICFLPTASGDSKVQIIDWYDLVKDLSIEPYVQGVWISSKQQAESFEEVFLNMDAIIVGGGNTLNMIAIWKAQGIDKAIKKALENGVVLAGGSAGSLCWFDNGITDSRPVELTVVEGLGFLPFSHSPHYNNQERRALYHQNIKEGIFTSGYAMDNKAGIIFKNGKPFRVVSIDETHHCYFVSLQDNKLVEEKLESIILK